MSSGAERLPTPHYLPGRRGERPRGIVVHTTAGTAAGASAWFAASESGVSAHYLVRLDGGIAQFVAEQDAARHAGRVRDPSTPLAEGDPNLHTIGIEFEDGGDPDGVERTAEQYRSGARLIREVAGRWEIPLDRAHVVGHREIFAAKSCPGNLDVERLVAEARRGVLVGLLAARDATADLPGFLESAGRLCDGLVALDDGSEDETRAVLEGSPLVKRLLANPPRPSSAGWDDGRNRQRLLDEAAELDPGWVIFLDADERLDAEDAAALRRFLDADALRGCAYGLRHCRMWGREECDPRFDYVYRLFAHEPGLRLPDERLHFHPIPESIPRGAWVRTTIRLKHLAAASAERRDARLAKYREADPEGRWGTNFGGLAELPDPERLVSWRRRAPGAPVLAPAPERATERAPRRSRVVCLLPARDCAAELPGWFASVSGFADAVVALDDGSTDATGAALERQPLVAELLRNPRRESAAGWDDRANRQRLLDAAAALRPDWIMQLDADERIDRDDAAALRRFLDEEAERDRAYGFRVFRMLGPDSYDRASLWAYRLFGFAPGQRLAGERLHLVPVPESIPRESWRKTTIRIQHLAGLTAERRRRRYAKYARADPDGERRGEYRALLDPPAAPRPWQRRPAGFPVLADPLRSGVETDLHELALDGPVLSAIVISRDDEDRIERAVRSVVEQRCPQPFEVIVVASGADRTAEIVRERFAQVRLIELEGEALPGRARNAGVAAARGEYVSFPGSHVELPPGSLAARLRAHELGHPMVTGTLLNGTPTPAGWASYFLDHAGSLPGRESGVLAGPPAHCSYRRDLLVELGGFPEDMRAGEDTVVNRLLFERGHRAYRSSEVRLVHRSRCETPARLARHHFGRGRAMGRIVAGDLRAGRLGAGALLRTWLLGYVRRRLSRTSVSVAGFGGPELRRRYRRVLPLVVLGTISAWAGIWRELLLGRASRDAWRGLALRRASGRASRPAGCRRGRVPKPAATAPPARASSAPGDRPR